MKEYESQRGKKAKVLTDTPNMKEVEENISAKQKKTELCEEKCITFPGKSI